MVSRELIQTPSFILSPWKLVQYLIFWFIGWNISASVNLSEFGFSISRIASFSEILLLWNVIKRTKTFLAVPLYFIYLSLRCLSSCHTFSAIFLSLFWIVSNQFIYLCQVNLLKCFFFLLFLSSSSWKTHWCFPITYRWRHSLWLTFSVLKILILVSLCMSIFPKFFSFHFREIY